MNCMDIHQIMALLPHRYPFLLVDRVVECSPEGKLVAMKNVSINEAPFQGHFPERPIYPGVLILEALAQASGILAFTSLGARAEDGQVYYFVGIDKARFKRPVEPGDQLRLEVDLIKTKRGIWMFEGRATVDGELCAKADLMCTVRDIDA
ncbi:MAG: 3-hydroxyacyl-ACP dehydratase FabZ [Gammaproteobacteria bacterium]